MQKRRGEFHLGFAFRRIETALETGAPGGRQLAANVSVDQLFFNGKQLIVKVVAREIAVLQRVSFFGRQFAQEVLSEYRVVAGKV